MLKLQKTIIIFCVLFAAVWVQSTKAVTKEEKQQIIDLTNYLTIAKNNEYWKSGLGINHFIMWESWNKIEDAVKLRIVFLFKNKLNEANLTIDSGTDEELAKLAYKALDEHIKNWLEVITKPIFHSKNEQAVKEGMEDLRQKGRFLHYMAFTGHPEKYLVTDGRKYLDDKIAKRLKLKTEH